LCADPISPAQATVHNPAIATQYTLYTEVEPFYRSLLIGVKAAEERVSMMYFTFDHGEWANRFSDALCERASAGVKVKLMVDEYGLMLDEPKHAVFNRLLMKDLERGGVEVNLFQPKGHRLNRTNRLHLKVCAVDDRAAFIGGSNVGDHYLEWSDHNLEMSGDVGRAFHDVYEYIEEFTPLADLERPDFHLSQLFAGGAQVWLTVPKQRKDIRRALLGVILDADEEVYIRSWYFIPDREILDALHSQAVNGVRVKILLSDKTKMPLIDSANPILAENLTKAGAEVYRYTSRYMHAKAAWNNKGDVLFGSANLDDKAMSSNFECSVVVRNLALEESLKSAFEKDCAASRLHQIGDFANRSLRSRALAHLCKLATPWL